MSQSAAGLEVYDRMGERLGVDNHGLHGSHGFESGGRLAANVQHPTFNAQLSEEEAE